MLEENRAFGKVVVCIDCIPPETVWCKQGVSRWQRSFHSFSSACSPPSKPAYRTLDGDAS